MTPQSVSEDDQRLLQRVRGGDTSAFGVLYDRHRWPAHRVAVEFLDSPSDVEDVVAEAFTAVLVQLLTGKGPDVAFGPYVISVVWRRAHIQNRLSARVQPTDDLAVLDSPELVEDMLLIGFETAAVAEAFASLSERWQAVLWYLDVEDMKPAGVSRILGTSANGVSTLALRAREGLRTAYLQRHIAVVSDRCRPYAQKLGKFARQGLGQMQRAKIQSHLDMCATCTVLLAGIDEVQTRLPALNIPRPPAGGGATHSFVPGKHQHV